MLFDKDSAISIAATEGYDRIIMSATLCVEEKGVLWSPDYDYDQTHHDLNTSSVIVSARMWWRPILDGLGAELRYAQVKDLPDGFAL